MSRVVRLVHNNLEKSLKNASNLVMCIAMIAMAIFLTYTNTGTYKTDGWKHQIELQNKSIEEFVENSTRMSNRVKTYYDNLIIKNDYALEHDIMPSDALDNANNILSMDVFIELLFIMIFSSFIVEEYSQRTMNNMLCSPNSRNQIIFAQFITGILIMIELLGILFLSSVIVTGCKYGFSHLVDPVVVVKNNGIVLSTVLVQLLKQIVMFLPQYFFTLCLTFALAHIFKKVVISTAIPMFLCFTGTIVADYLSKYKIGVLWPYVHTNMTQYYDGSQYYEFLSIGWSLAILLCYGILMYILSLVFVQKKR